MEAIATLLAIVVGAMAMVRFYAKKDNTFLFIGTGFVGTGLLDGYHAIVTSSFFASNFPSAPSSLIPWSWIASRLFLSVLLWLSWMAWSREARLGEEGKISEGTVYLVTGALTVASFLFFAFVPLPRAYYPEIIFHRPEEFVPALFFLLALVGYLRKGSWRTDDFEHWLVLSLIVGFMGQAIFMSYSGRLFDFEFDVAHLLKKVSYIAVLVGLLISIFHLFRQLESQKVLMQAGIARRERAEEELRRSEDRLRESYTTLEQQVADRTRELSTANTDLEVENAQRTRAEVALAQRARELARSNQELQQFASVASHDLQEPLRKVSAFGDLLEASAADALTEKGRDYLRRMQGAAARMKTLIDDLLTLSRVTTQAQPFVAVDLTKVTREVVADLEVRIKETGGCVEVWDIPTIDADRTQMRQLLQNLIGNALKFHRPGEPPVVRVRGSLLEGQTNGGNGVHAGEEMLRLTVEDNGIGFDETYLDRIFTVFQRLHGRGEYEGSGIGLAVCRKIVERHAGAITAKSECGRGSTFIATLPVNKRPIDHSDKEEQPWTEMESPSPY